ncbi:MAG: hypothetical protein AAGI68_00280 [Planctomycetota bacterium]
MYRFSLLQLKSVSTGRVPENVRNLTRTGIQAAAFSEISGFKAILMDVSTPEASAYCPLFRTQGLTESVFIGKVQGGPI